MRPERIDIAGEKADIAAGKAIEPHVVEYLELILIHRAEKLNAYQCLLEVIQNKDSIPNAKLSLKIQACIKAEEGNIAECYQALKDIDTKSWQQ